MNEETLDSIGRLLLFGWLALGLVAMLKEGGKLMRSTPVGWMALGVAVGAVGMMVWHTLCLPCQARAAAWRRAVGSRLIE